MQDISKLSVNERKELLELLEQKELETVSPKMELFRKPYRIKIAHGGRGAGAKSWGCASLLIQKANWNPLRICCFREVQRSLEESSYRLMVDTIARLGYKGWKITNEYLDSPIGSHIIFRGLKDMRAADQMKSLEGYDIFWLEEASAISKESLAVLLPTLRKPGSELWATLNREAEKDPIIAEYWDSPRTDVLRIELEEGKIDNPWFPDILEQERITAYETNPDEAMHVWGGKPRVQGDNAVLSRVQSSKICRAKTPHRAGLYSDMVD
jgi:phage terminase large subunit